MPMPVIIAGGVPTITSYSPTSGAIGAKVTIKGTNLEDANSASFNGTSAVIKSDSATSLKVKVPSGVTTGKISVTTSGGTVTSATKFKVT
jgi:IPT/TIG domain